MKNITAKVAWLDVGMVLSFMTAVFMSILYFNGVDSLNYNGCVIHTGAWMWELVASGLVLYLAKRGLY